MATLLTVDERNTIIGELERRLEGMAEDILAALSAVQNLDGETYDDSDLFAVERHAGRLDIEGDIEPLRSHLDAVEEAEEADTRTFSTNIATDELVCDTCGAAFDTWTGAEAHKGCEPDDEEDARQQAEYEATVIAESNNPRNWR